MKVIVIALCLIVGIHAQSKWVSYDPCDKRWKDSLLDTGGTYCKNGTLLSSLSMIYSTLQPKCKRDCQPPMVQLLFRDNFGYQYGTTLFGTFRRGGLDWLGCSMDRLVWKEWILRDIPVVVQYEENGEWGVAEVVSNNKLIVSDPRKGLIEKFTDDVQNACAWELVKILS